MAVSVTHTFVSPVADAGDPDIVGPNEWNDAHQVTGLGTAAEANVGDFATAAQGATADTAVQPGDLATVATTGDYNDLINAPGGLSDGDKGDIVVSSSGTVWEFDSGVITAFSKSFLSAANEAGFKATVNLEIGVDVQAWNANLDEWATLNPSANGGSLVTAADYSAMRTLLSLVPGTNVQAYDATLAALAAYNTNGILVQTAADTFAGRTLTGPAAGISVSNGNGVSGNPTLALANDLSALEGLASTGIAVRTTTDTWAQRTITGTSNEITVTNGDGVSGNPTLALHSGVYRASGTDVALADGGTGASLTDPNADRIMFWDDSAGAVKWLTAGTNLTITGTTIDAAGGSVPTTTNTVGTYILGGGNHGASGYAYGATVAGSTITVGTGFTTAPALATASVSLSGTWRVMGHHQGLNSTNHTLYVRTV